MDKKTGIAVIYQKTLPPVIGGARKPIKDGGYSDSGADIAYALKQNGYNVVTPIQNPHPENNYDWVFPDTTEGIKLAMDKGANIIWANTILFNEHPLKNFPNHKLSVIGQNIYTMQQVDDKEQLSHYLKNSGFPCVPVKAINLTGNDNAVNFNSLDEKSYGEIMGLPFPLVLKPIRGRGSQGVKMVENLDEFFEHAGYLLNAKYDENDKENSGQPIFGGRIIAEPYLSGEEITITVMPGGVYDGEKKPCFCLPLISRWGHIGGVVPYSGKVNIQDNSAIIAPEEINDAHNQISQHCALIGDKIGVYAPIRIDCRQYNGKFYIFDVNTKPNITSSLRPSRKGKDSLVTISAQEYGWDYIDLLENILQQRRNIAHIVCIRHLQL